MKTTQVLSEVKTHSTLVFRTGLNTPDKIKTVTGTLDTHPYITRWCVDMDDVDKVLKVESSPELDAGEVIHLIQSHGFFCEELPD